MNAPKVHVTNLSKIAKEHRAALANPECRGEPSSQEIPHAEQVKILSLKPGTDFGQLIMNFMKGWCKFII